MAQYGCYCILRTTTYYFWLLRGSRTHSSLAFICYCHLSLQYDNKERLSHCWRLHCGVAINLIAGTLPLCNHRCGSLTLMKKVGCCWRNLASSLHQLVLSFPTIWQKLYHCRRCFLQYNIKNWSSHVGNVVGVAMYFIVGTLCLRDLCSLPCNTTQKMLVAVWHNLTFPRCNQPFSLLLLAIGHTKICSLPSLLQSTTCKKLIAVSLCLAMVGLSSLHAPWQYDCFSQHQKYYVLASLAMQHQGYAYCHRLLHSTAADIWLLHFIIIPQLLAYCDVCIVVLLCAPSWYDIKKCIYRCLLIAIRHEKYNSHRCCFMGLTVCI